MALRAEEERQQGGHAEKQRAPSQFRGVFGVGSAVEAHDEGGGDQAGDRARCAYRGHPGRVADHRTGHSAQRARREDQPEPAAPDDRLEQKTNQRHGDAIADQMAPTPMEERRQEQTPDLPRPDGVVPTGRAQGDRGFLTERAARADVESQTLLEREYQREADDQSERQQRDRGEQTLHVAGRSVFPPDNPRDRKRRGASRLSLRGPNASLAKGPGGCGSRIHLHPLPASREPSSKERRCPREDCCRDLPTSYAARRYCRRGDGTVTAKALNRRAP